MSDPPPAKRRRRNDQGDEGSQPKESAGPSEGAFVYTGQPASEIPRNITQLLVDSSVRSIENEAFRNCQELQSISIPPTVEIIGNEAFSGCISLTEVRLQEGLQHIGSGAFYKCTSLSDIELPNGITDVRASTFSLCKSLRTVSMPITVTKIGPHAFAECVSLVDVLLPRQLKRISVQAFRSCHGLSSITFPSSLESIGQRAFIRCKSLLSVEFLPTANMKIGVLCFAGADSLVNVWIPRFMSDRILFGAAAIDMEKRNCLRQRFANHPVHHLCYRSTPISKNEILRILDSADTLDASNSFKDAFGMTPFHVLATSAGLNPEKLECLLDRYPMNILGCQDSFGNTMMEYLLKHTSPRAVPLLRKVLSQAVVNTISTWHPQGDWENNLSMLVESIPMNSDLNERRQCMKDFFGHVGYCSRIEITSILDLAAWKTKMQSMTELETDSNGDNSERRNSYRYQSGAGILMENVVGYLWGCESTFDTAISLFPLCSSSITTS